MNCRRLTADFSKKITVTTNDPDHPKEYLTCKGKILEAAKINPNRVFFGQVSRTEAPPPKKLVLTRGDGGTLNLKLPPVTTEGLRAELREIEAGERYELEVALVPPLKSNNLRANITLETGIAEAPTISVPVTARIAPRVQPKPSRFTVPAERSPDWEQSVQLQWDDNAPHKILAATASDPGLKVEVVEKDGQQQVVLKVVEGYEAHRKPCVVTIKTDDTVAPEVKVPVTMRGNNPKAMRNRGVETRRKGGARTAQPGGAKTGTTQGTTTKPKASEGTPNKEPEKAKGGVTREPA